MHLASEKLDEVTRKVNVALPSPIRARRNLSLGKKVKNANSLNKLAKLNNRNH